VLEEHSRHAPPPGYTPPEPEWKRKRGVAGALPAREGIPADRSFRRRSPLALVDCCSALTSGLSAIIAAVGSDPIDMHHAVPLPRCASGDSRNAGSNNAWPTSGASLANDQGFGEGRTVFYHAGEIRPERAH